MKDHLPIQESEQPPATLRWVSGGLSGQTPSRPFDPDHGCGLSLELTNTTQNLIQIPSTGVQVMKGIERNNYQYRRIDGCSLVPKLCTPLAMGGGAGKCDVYDVIFKLTEGEVGTTFSGSLSPRTQGCYELTLNPKEYKVVFIHFYTSQNLIYHVLPELTLTTSSGKTLVPLAELTWTLTFANANQFACYGLQGDTFVMESSPSRGCM